MINHLQLVETSHLSQPHMNCTQASSTMEPLQLLTRPNDWVPMSNVNSNHVNRHSNVNSNRVPKLRIPKHLGPYIQCYSSKIEASSLRNMPPIFPI